MSLKKIVRRVPAEEVKLHNFRHYAVNYIAMRLFGKRLATIADEDADSNPAECLFKIYIQHFT